ncbi:MAG: hypothetical protein LBH62_07835 [Nitrososphaerota archaeon]|jgi:hypothetical protein|nr:hypothetical protein [Nitrososphaerota archaeon]
MSEDIDDIWRLWGFNESNDSNTVIKTVDQNVIKLVNSILKEEPTTLVQIGRKAAHLIREYKNQIEEKKFLTCLLLMYKYNDLTQYKPEILKDKPVILMVDTIHHGIDLRDVITSFKKSHTQISKIFCYIKNQDGVNNLVKHNLLKEEQIVSLFTSYSEIEYREKVKDLHAYFRSHIEPTDPDICYNVYRVNTQLTVEQLIEITEPVLFKILDTVSMEKIADTGFASNIQEAKYTTTNNKILQKWSDSIIRGENSYEISGLDLRFKINQRSIDSEFSVIPKIEADCIVSEGVNNKKCFTHKEHCMLNHYKHKDITVQELKNTICPQCLDIVVSDNLLESLNNELSLAFKESKRAVILKEKSRPVPFV